MRAIVCSPAGPDRIELRDVPEPAPARDEVVIRVRAFSLNRGEFRRLQWETDGWRPGYDVAGVVERPAADGSGPAEGQRVIGLLRNCAWSERVAVPSRVVVPIPDGVGFEAASTVPVAGLTSLAALAHGGMLVGKRVLVTGAAGGVGRFAVQLARIAGARVTAEVSKAERGDGLLEIGADDVVVGLQPAGAAFDFALESVGGPLLAAVISRLAPGGTVVSIGVSSDEPTTLDWLAAVRRGAVTLYGMSLFQEMERQGMGGREMSTLLELVALGRLRPEIDRVVSWRDLGPTLRALGDRTIAGKAVALVD